MASVALLSWAVFNAALFPWLRSWHLFPVLIWAALAYAGLGTLIAHLIGWRLIPLQFSQQRYESDFRFAIAQGFNTGDDFSRYLIDAFDVFYREGLEGRPKMMSVGLHNRLVGRPGRFAGLVRFLDHVQRHDRAWLCRRVDIARHWRAHFPPA